MGHNQPTTPRVRQLRSYLALLAGNRDYRFFWSAGVVSQIGNWFNYIAIFVLLERLTGKGSAVSLFLIAKFLPTAVLGSAAGIIADRLSRRAILITCDLARAGVVLGFLLVERAEHVWLIYLLAVIQESLWSFYDPARRASLPNICKPNELVLANALSGATWSVMLAMGAAIGGFVTAMFGWQTAILIDSATFGLSAWLLSRVPIPSPAKKTTQKTTWLTYTGLPDLIEGLTYLHRHRQTTAILLVKSGWALSGGILVLLAVFGEQVFSQGGQGGKSGILYSFRGIGAAIGPILAWNIFGETRRDMFRSISIGFLTAAVAYILFARSETLLIASLLIMVAHMGGSVQWVFSTTLLQQSVEDRFRGRVFATEMAIFTLILSLSTYFTGLGLDQGVSPRTMGTALGALFLLPCLFWTLYVMIIDPE